MVNRFLQFLNLLNAIHFFYHCHLYYVTYTLDQNQQFQHLSEIASQITGLYLRLENHKTVNKTKYNKASAVNKCPYIEWCGSTQSLFPNYRGDHRSGSQSQCSWVFVINPFACSIVAVSQTRALYAYINRYNRSVSTGMSSHYLGRNDFAVTLMTVGNTHLFRSTVRERTGEL